MTLVLPKDARECRVRGCDGCVPWGHPTYDGSTENCTTCGREHTATVFEHGGPLLIEVARAPRTSESSVEHVKNGKGKDIE